MEFLVFCQNFSYRRQLTFFSTVTTAPMGIPKRKPKKKSKPRQEPLATKRSHWLCYDLDFQSTSRKVKTVLGENGGSRWKTKRKKKLFQNDLQWRVGKLVWLAKWLVGWWYWLGGKFANKILFSFYSVYFTVTRIARIAGRQPGWLTGWLVSLPSLPARILNSS